MVTKTITVTKDAYERLKALKRPEESFSEEIKRITGGKQDIMRFAGALSYLSDEETEEIKSGIRQMRARASKQFRERFKERFK
ncbi:antitoxin VapB family protein [Candidatus Woesearchaeota archaeon]|nr:antitoxin VapB family protein [Candidatus Woesearchaeota archaeon]